MVFDWFQRRRRRVESGPQAAETPPAPPAAPPEADLPGEGQPAAAPAPEPAASPVAEPAAADSPDPEPEPESKPDPDPDQDPLAWAREAYARLKAQQQSQAAAAESLPAEPAPAERPAAEPEPPEPPPEPEPEPSTPSLLERAAAERDARLREQRERALLAPDRPAADQEVGQGVDQQVDQEPVKLGSFDADFTWSAEVLAAQGRRPDQVSLEEIDWLGRLRRGLEKTRQGFVTQLLTRLGDDPLTPEVLDELETLLLRADAGVQATDRVLDALRARMNEAVVDSGEGLAFLKQQLRELLEAPIRASGAELLVPGRERLNVWLLVGVNGVGKTTTLGKLANLAVRSGYRPLIAAADTFRAAAVEQVRIWGERSGVEVIANPTANADPAAVVFDALGAARSQGSDLLLVDTAGRLQTKHNLMEELAKIRRIIDRQVPEAQVESLLVLDASQGQNGLRQAMAFARAAQLTGVVLTKLDGSARGGVALAVSSEAGLPIRFIGAGEGLRDLRPFNSYEFVEALLAG